MRPNLLFAAILLAAVNAQSRSIDAPPPPKGGIPKLDSQLWDVAFPGGGLGKPVAAG